MTHDDVPNQDNAGWLERYSRVMLPLFSPGRVLVRGQGVYVWDAEGKRYLDLFGGIAVNTLGHAHPALTSAIWQQLATLGHISNLAASPPQIELAEKLASLTAAPDQARVFFSNSGTEAVEAAVKIALRTGRPRILALEGGFHGRTLGSLALTSNPEYRKPFEPLPGGVEFLPHGDTKALRAAMAEDVAAIVLEVIQGEGGVRPLPPDYLAQARKLADIYRTLLIVDEVQTGMGRTGTWFAHANPRLVDRVVIPDVVTLAKGLGGGFPMGATITLSKRASELLGKGQHGTTFGGNPPACAAGLAVIQAIEDQGLLANTEKVGDALEEAVLALKHPEIAGVRGAGLLRAIVLAKPLAERVATLAASEGFLVNAVKPDAIRLAPPLIVTQPQILAFVGALPRIFDALERTSPHATALSEG
ncbi:MAG: acetylornithine transaminase [Micrococcales bacterium]|nr:acetylornithine transaminase [Micrococcales bacterium]